MEPYNLGVIAGITVGILLGVLLLFLTKKNGNLKGEYDERQQLIRGRGFKYAFFTMLIFNGVVYITEVADINLHAETGALLVIELGIGVCVYASYAILNDAYWALNEKVPNMIAVFGVLAVINSAATINYLREGKIIVAGVLTNQVSNLVVSLMLIEILLVLLIKYGLDKKGGAED